MKYACLLFLLLAMLSLRSQSTTYDVESIPQELKSRAAVTIRNESVYIEMRSDNDMLQKVKKAITVYNRNGDDYAFIPLYYNKSAIIKSAKGMIYDASGNPIKKIGSKDFMDVSAADGFSMFSDTRLKYYQYNAVQYPYTIEFEYEIQHKQNLIIPAWNPNFSEQVSVQQSEYIFAAPATAAIRTYTQHTTAEPTISHSDKFTIRKWETGPVPAVREENYTRGFRERSILVYVVPQQISYYGRKGSFDTWEQFGKWAYDNLLQGKQDLDAMAKNKVLQLTKDCKTDKEKAKVLYHYLQQKTRYISIQVGIGGLEPFNASDVERYGYGDCKALVNYMQNLLSLVDIPSYYCVVEAGGFKQSLKTEFANVQDGNHIILCIPFEQDTTWLECTSQEMPFGFLGDFTDDRLVLAWTPKGGKVLRTPIYTDKENKQIREAKLKLVDLTNLEGSIKTKFYGTQYDNHADVLHANNTEKPKLLAKRYDINNVNFANITYSEIENDTPHVLEDFSISIPNIAIKSDNRVMLPSSLFNAFTTIQRNEGRQQPIYINRGFTDEDYIEIKLPDEVNKKMTPMVKTFTCPMGEYTFTARIDGNTLQTKRTLIIKQGTYAPTHYTVFQEFLKSVNQTDKGRFFLELL
ncbi:DUF3857 domain-containing protein [Sphingobacterium suaedae]|uniref:DUF3857 domain-containing protein n=1 Tax=Sphingobacterium suaedae TaxID=1686402 RepID=A0ABW5KB31_9SPHI